jgi:O-antigen/teichoic acid export membrane protein
MEENKNLKHKTLSNFVWKFAERGGAQGVSFIVSIVLARMLSPNDYGLLALITVFISIFNVFVDCGLGSALIQKKDADDLDFSTVFFCNIVFCTFLYIILFFSAPMIAGFYENTELIPIIRVLGVTILISGVRSIQSAYVSKHMIFKKFFFATIFGTIGAAAVGITMAKLGLGVWALVGQQLFNNIFGTVVLWVTVKWRPKKMFSFHRLKGLFSFGWKLLVSGLINTVYNDIRQLIIGKLYSSEDLGFYNKGKQFPNLVVENVNTSIDSVLFPVLSECQDTPQRLKELTRRAIRTSGYIMWPLMMGLAAVGEPLVTLLLTEKWLPCLPYMYIFCFTCGMMPIQTANLNAIKALGRSDLFLKMEIIKKTVNMVIIIAVSGISVFAIGLAGIPIVLVAAIVNIFPNKRLLGYSYWEQIKDIAPMFLMSLLMAVIVYLVGKILPFHIIINLIIQVLSGAIVYIAESIIFKVDIFYFLLNTLKSLIKKMKGVKV